MRRGDHAAKHMKNERKTFPSADGKSFYIVGSIARSQRAAIGCPTRVRREGTGAGTSCQASNHAGH